MKKIKLEDINFSLLRKLDEQGTESAIYTDGDVCYKMLNNLYPEEKDELYRKIIDTEGLELDNVILPIDLIIKNEKLVGYTMKYIQNSTALYDLFSGRYIDSKKLFDYLNKVSIILRKLHQKEIICQDLNFGNILVADNDIFLCDFDSYSYSKYESPFVSLRLKKFINGYRKEAICINKNLDRISILLSLYDLIFFKEIQKITKKQHNLLSEHLETFKNCRIYIEKMINRNASLPEIPYIDELININDDYIIDRNKVLTLFDRLF